MNRSILFALASVASIVAAAPQAQTTTPPAHPKHHTSKAKPAQDTASDAATKRMQDVVDDLKAQLASLSPEGQIDPKDMPHIDGTPNLARTFDEVRVRQTDQFSPTPTITSLAGEPFEVRVKADPSGPLNWLYSPGQLTFSLDTDVSGRTGMLQVRQQTRHLDDYVGENAFGATTHVSGVEEFIDAIQIQSLPAGSEAGLGASFAVSGDAARTLSKNVSVVIGGTFQNVNGGRVATCELDTTSATLERPTDFKKHVCWIGVAITRIAYVNSTTGQVLRSWPPTPAH